MLLRDLNLSKSLGSFVCDAFLLALSFFLHTLHFNYLLQQMPEKVKMKSTHLICISSLKIGNGFFGTNVPISHPPLDRISRNVVEKILKMQVSGLKKI